MLWENIHIYKMLRLKYPDLTDDEFQMKLQNTLKQLVNNIREFSTTIEIDKFNTPMGFLFQHLKVDIVNIIASLSPLNDKVFLESNLCNYIWHIRLFNCMMNLNAKDLILWYFLQIPYYMTSLKNIEKYRVIYEQMLDYLFINWKDSFTEQEFIYISNETCMPYAISYHNQNNVIILQKYSKLLRKICPWLSYYSPKLSEKILTQSRDSISRSKSKYKICFISDSFNTDSSVLRDRISIIGKLDKTLYDVYIASFNNMLNNTIRGKLSTLFINKFKDKYIYLKSLQSARTVLDNYEFDMIIYPDLGMKLLPTLLAYSRISRVQITTWGHSETSGIDTIDYYISSKWFESLDAQLYYSEKLILFDSLGTYYVSPSKLFIDVNMKMKTREELGFRSTDNIYCCLQTFYKINDEFEQCLSNILTLDPKGIILLSNAFPYCKSHLSRIKNCLGDEKIKQIRWYGSLEKHEFLNLVQISNVCLDPFPFGGCNTTFDAFDYNIPVITYPSNYLHGRFTLGLYNKMGMYDCECIVSNKEDYARIATEICINTKLCHKINRNIEMNKHTIFQEQASIDEWNNLSAILHLAM